ncbi:MAG: HetZ-related protein [Cyanobacteria bacterium J06627_3]
MKAQSTATSVLNLTTRKSSNNVVLHPTAGSSIQPPKNDPESTNQSELCPVDQALVSFLISLIQEQVKGSTRTVNAVANRLAIEVARICRKSDRIQASGEVNAWQHSLAENRIQKYLEYYRLGSRQGRVELQSRLSAIAYRYIAPAKTQLGFQGRCNLLEDFLQGFYIEVLKAFRRENHLEADYTPKTRLELAEYMAFSEQYAKRRISLPGCYNQQLLVLRAQSFAKRLPAETCVDIEMAVDSPKSDDADSRSSALQQIREQMVADVTDPAEAVLRDRIIRELVDYLEDQDQPACIDYLALRLQDMAASEIDEVLGLTPRQRDYLQQRFKYHVEKFAQSHNWELVHQWLGADLDKNLGLSPKEWTVFIGELSADQQHLLALKQQQMQDPQHATPSDAEIAQQLGWTPKRVQRRWSQIVSSAWKLRNTNRVAKPVVKTEK